MKQKKILSILPLLWAVACGGAASQEATSPDGAPMAQKKIVVSQQAKKDHGAALEAFVRHEQAFDWTDATCKSVADQFVRASEQQKSDLGKGLPTALYNAGVAYMRCGMEAEGQKQFQASIEAEPTFHRGRAQVALFEYQKTKNLDAAIDSLEKIIRDARFQNVEALVSVAALQMERGGDQVTGDGANDLERAKKNIQRALAIDDSYMPAFNQLATYYLESAKRKAGGRKGRRRGLVVAGVKQAKANQQQLELAALVTAQAIGKNPNYAPIHNTAGLIQVEMDNFNGAVKSFANARSLDAKFFEAHMNYAAVNLSFRGFKEARTSYLAALKLEPNDYEAHLGLGLAYRGEINDSNFDANIALVQNELDTCKKLDASRPEAYYNEAILTQEFRSKSSGDPKKSVPVLESARKQYEAFIAKAGGDQVFAQAVKVSKDRIKDISDTVQFITDGEKMRIEQEAQDKAAAEAEKEAAEAEKEAAEAEKAAAEAEKAPAAAPPPSPPPAAAPAQ